MIDQRKLDTIVLAAKVKANEIMANYRLYMSAERSYYDGDIGGRNIPEATQRQPEDVGGEAEEPGEEIALEVYGENGGGLV